MDTLVSTGWLSDHLHDPDMVVLDCTVNQVTVDGAMKNISGRPDYDARHIPSAGFADLMDELSDTCSPLEFTVPSPEQFCTAMGSLGVGDDSRVVLYDANFSAWAARVWWMLRWVGFDHAAILDGGLKLWIAEERPLSTKQAHYAPNHLSPAPRPELIANRDEVLAAIRDDSVCLIDTMPEAHYRGDMTMYDRPGHIPSAVNISGLNLLSETGRYRPETELNTMFPIDRNSRSITYCGGGILATSSAFIMTRLGFKDVAVYTASLQEWAADPANPLETEQANE